MIRERAREIYAALHRPQFYPSDPLDERAAIIERIEEALQEAYEQGKAAANTERD